MEKQNFFRIIKEAFTKERKIFFLTLFNSIFKSFSNLFIVYGIGNIIDSLTKNDEKIFQKIILFVGIPLLIDFISNALSFYINYLTRIATNKLQCSYIDDALKINYQHVQSKDILNLKRKSISGHPIFYINIIGEIFTNIFKIIGLIFIFAYYSSLFIILLLFLNIIILIIKQLQKKKEFAFKNNIIDDNRQSEYLFNAMTSLTFAKDIRINNGKKILNDKLKNVNNEKLRKEKNYYFTNNILNLLLNIISVIITCLIYIICTYKVYNNMLLLSAYSVLISSSILLSSTFSSLFDNLIKLSYYYKYERLYDEYTKVINEMSSIFNTNKSNENINTDNFVIEFKNVSFKYPEDDFDTLKNISFTINNQQKIGIIGLNGAGKTTIIKLILRLYTPSNGKILLNGIDINTLPLNEYIKNISVVLQDYFIFAYSIKENIVFDNYYNDNNLFKALSFSGLNKKITKLENGINTILYKDLNDDGIELSGGENQKLSIARSYYKNGKLFIFDEATSNLDPIAEYELYKNIKDFIDDKSTIIISHKLTFTSLCDYILLIENGTIIERGTHEELMTKNGRYYKLFTLQSKNYEVEEYE